MHRRLGSVFLPLLLVALVAASCGSDDAESTTSTTSTTTTVASSTTTEAPTDTTTTSEAPGVDCSVIGDDGIPIVPANASEADVLAALGANWTSTFDDAYLVDLAGYQFACGGETIFYGAWGLGGAEVASIVISDHPSFVDPAGVGPGMTLADAIALRGGAATIGLSVDFEQREFVSFADGGEPGWGYRVGSDNGYAGVYPEPLSGYVETSTFVDDATITSIWWEPGGGTAVAGDAEHPLSGTVTALDVGDISCYVGVVDESGVEGFVGATFDICLQDELLDNEANFNYEIVDVSACASAEPCGLTEEALLIVEAVLA